MGNSFVLQSNMKHHVNIIFLGLFLNLCYGTPTGPTTPTFSLSEERSFDGSPKINIVFANGKSDTMILTKFNNGEDEDKIETEEEVEDCRYLGHLENEPSACIAMVGCPGVEKVEFTIFSKNVFDSPAYVWTKEGSVEMVETDDSPNWDHHDDDDDDDDTYVPPEPMADNATYVPVPIEEDRAGKDYWKNDGYCDDVNNNPAYDFDGGDCCKDASIDEGKKVWNGNSDAGGCLECRCKTMKLDLKIGYGKGFKSNAASQGNNVEKYIKRVMALVQPYYCHESLGHRIKLSYPQYHEYYEDFNFRRNDNCVSTNKGGSKTCNRDEVYDLVANELGEADLMVLLGYDEYDFKNGKFKSGKTGVGNTKVVCKQSNKKYKWSINEDTNRGYGRLAATIAHEIGHNVGMEHDHKAIHKGKDCNCKGIMSYKKNCKNVWIDGNGILKRPVSWSTCSKNDFIKQYDSQKDNWCMDPFTTNFCAKGN